MSHTYLDLLAYFGIGGAHPGGFTLTKSLFENLPILPTESVLDIGCGTGQTAAFLAKRFDCQVIAVDNHPVMVEKAKERMKSFQCDVSVMKGDVQNLELADDSVDLVISESVLIFTDITKALTELARVLKNEGSMIIIEMTANQYISEELQKKACRLYGIREILTAEEWKVRLLQAGFEKIDIINTPSELTPSDIDDYNPSEHINEDYFDLWEQHNEFIHQSNPYISYRVFKCRLG
ncbi:class I SAM-dependent methyltransferase [Bacillus sp. FJAT-22090]|uniref:class I SAM-dependent methyltransferase n=1 Tax=Bacillus sp. FJAT-22090 TaxID=1581038 RepID=UPI0011A9CD8A|nr:class I SAM-dependent methyltransferase [Bacillus sp. FJAT-22090]